jgi:Cd2+/Zn2+-exporting ATPase
MIVATITLERIMIENSRVVAYKVKGLDCANCARSLENGIQKLDHVEFCEVNFSTESLKVEGSVTPAEIEERVRQLGYELVSTEDTPQKKEEKLPNFIQYLWQSNETRLALLGALLIFPGFIFEELLGYHSIWIDAASVLAMIVAGIPIVKSAWSTLRYNREVNINVLMTIAGIGAVVIGAYTEAGMVMVLFAIGEALEGYTAEKARFAIRSLVSVMPNEALLVSRAGSMVRNQTVHINELQIGDHIRVKPGERIPMDGTILSGASSINQAPITGESRLIEKLPGDNVYASSINGEGVLEIAVTHLAADNTISRLIKMVEEAQEKRAPAQRFIDNFAKYYTPIVVVLALLVVLIPTILFNQPLWGAPPETPGWLYRGLALLIISCPCALVISTPVSIISAISNAARNGVLIKGGAYLEQLSQVDAIAFDKTGTLTLGKPQIISARALNCPVDSSDMADGYCQDCKELLVLANAVESQSEHPLANAIRLDAERYNMPMKLAENVKAVTGKGIVGSLEGQEIFVGSHKAFNDISHPEAHCQQAAASAALGQTPVMVSYNHTYQGLITVADQVRETSKQAVNRLKQLGIRDLVMISGDNEMTAQSIARQVGIDQVKSELLPESKVAAVQGLKQDHKAVVMVGDGINDAPALATADISVAMGSALGGSDQAMETASITLMRDDLRLLPYVIQLSRSAMRTIRMNVGLVLLIKLTFFVLTLLGTGTMWMAVIADTGASLLVTMIGLTLIRWPKFKTG